MSTTFSKRAARSDAEKESLNGRLELIGWGLFLIMLGGAAMVPQDRVPQGIWSVGAGLIMLGVNAVRLYFGIKLNGFTVFVGVISLASGLGQYLGIELPILPILIILIGANMLLKVFVGQRRS